MATGGPVVQGVLLDALLLFASSDHNDQNPTSASACLRPAADSLLRKLRYSKIRTVISFFFLNKLDY